MTMPTTVAPDTTAALAAEVHTILEPGAESLMAAMSVLVSDIQTLTDVVGLDKATIAALTAHTAQLQATLTAAQAQPTLVAEPART